MWIGIRQNFCWFWVSGLTFLVSWMGFPDLTILWFLALKFACLDGYLQTLMLSRVGVLGFGGYGGEIGVWVGISPDFSGNCRFERFVLFVMNSFVAVVYFVFCYSGWFCGLMLGLRFCVILVLRLGLVCLLLVRF